MRGRSGPAHAYRAGEACPACASTTVTSDGACLACGHAWGEAHRCTHCGRIASARDGRDGVLVCGACGLPRVARGWVMPRHVAERIRNAARWPLGVRVHLAVNVLQVVSVAAVVLDAVLGGRTVTPSGWAFLVMFGVTGVTGLLAQRSTVDKMRRKLAEAIEAGEETRRNPSDAAAEGLAARVRVDATAGLTDATAPHEAEARGAEEDADGEVGGTSERRGILRR